MFAEQILPRARERLVTIDGAAPVKDAAALMAKTAAARRLLGKFMT